MEYLEVLFLTNSVLIAAVNSIKEAVVSYVVIPVEKDVRTRTASVS